MDATVVCKQLGISLGGMVVTAANTRDGSGKIWLDDVDCNGGEDSIFKCGHNGFGVHNCFHYDDIGVECSGTFKYYHRWFEIFAFLLNERRSKSFCDIRPYFALQKGNFTFFHSKKTL